MCVMSLRHTFETGDRGLCMLPKDTLGESEVDERLGTGVILPGED